MNIFGQRIKELRIEKKLSRNDLAKQFSVSVRLISYWENGERECDFDTLIRISDFFNVSTDFLLGKKDY